ncbi:hypothetical protein [Sulfitobacter donghicola]|uniref:Uncharacterized protein n=1 Tax=Sulfitobacter donghicola DSW-25 = KCTC 12864 = JCM 14565 TaxID=1300350 RepID=A0A073IL94_9RHOB|nr:hypothetical protein [Sulfitobacter donghicola]KEJ91073.1 hypothetical protein DSW25_02465 [Sulfitobacter donghicola DSW-25 = KCTC 12864 = JCM 14565]
MNRDAALQATREQLEAPVWGLIEELEKSLSSLAGTPHVDISCPRAVGSVLNCALPSASLAAGLGDQDLEVTYCRNGQCNKLSGEIEIAGSTYKVSLELHLSGPRGGTTKKKHQFAKSDVAVCDIEQQPLLLEYDVEAPDRLLFFIACHLSGTGVSIARAYFKFADGVDQRMLEIHRPDALPMAAPKQAGPDEGPLGTIMKVRKPEGEKKEDGIKTNKRGDAASSS